MGERNKTQQDTQPQVFKGDLAQLSSGPAPHWGRGNRGGLTTAPRPPAHPRAVATCGPPRALLAAPLAPTAAGWAGGGQAPGGQGDQARRC